MCGLWPWPLLRSSLPPSQHLLSWKWKPHCLWPTWGRLFAGSLWKAVFKRCQFSYGYVIKNVGFFFNKRCRGSEEQQRRGYIIVWQYSAGPPPGSSPNLSLPQLPVLGCQGSPPAPTSDRPRYINTRFFFFPVWTLALGRTVPGLWVDEWRMMVTWRGGRIEGSWCGCVYRRLHPVPGVLLIYSALRRRPFLIIKTQYLPSRPWRYVRNNREL